MAKVNPLDSFEKDEILWKDRKRILGMPLSFTKYSVDRNRLHCQKGFFKTTIDELLLYRILDIKSVRTLGQKICGVGTVTLFSADQTNPTFELKNIKKPDKVRAFLSKLIETERTSKGLVGREIYGAGVHAAHEDCCGDGAQHFVDIDGDGIPD